MEQIESMLAKKGFSILPCRLTQMSETAAKVLRLVLENRTVTFSAREAALILEMAQLLLEKGVLRGD